MVTNRLTRVQCEVNKLEEKKHFKFEKGNIVEQNCRDEMEKLCNLIANILGKKAFGDGAKGGNNTSEEDEEARRRRQKAEDDAAEEARRKRKEEADANRVHDVMLDLPHTKNTEFDEFNIGRRERKVKPLHNVYKFIENLQALIQDPKFIVKMFMPKKKLFLMLEQT